MRPVLAPLTHGWAISDEGMRLVLSVVSYGQLFPEARAKARADLGGEPMKNDHSYEVRDNGVAVVPVFGPMIVRHASMFDEMSAITSYADIRRDCLAARNDPAVKATLLHLDTPGGDANGCGDTAELIYRLSHEKLIESFISGSGCSAGWWLASATSRRTAAQSAFLGSIGVRSALFDVSEAEKKAGIREVQIISSRAPGKRDTPIDDEIIAKAQARVDALEDIFITEVARYCGVTVDEVVEKFGAGDILIASKAQAAGMIQGIGTIDDAVEELGERVSTSTSVAVPRPQANQPRTSKTAQENATMTMPKKPSTQPRAEGEPMPPEGKKKAEGDKPGDQTAEGDKCATCDGSGEMPDGTKCKDCDGTGKMKSQEGEKPADDKGKKPESTNDKDGDDAARGALAKLAGVGADSKLSTIAAALEAKTVPLTAQAQLEREVAELKSKLEARETAEKKSAAKAFADDAIRAGCTTEDKRARVEAEHAEKGEKAAKDLLFQPGTFTALRRFTDGKGEVIGKAHKPSTIFAQDDPSEIEAAMGKAMKKIAAEKKIKVSAVTGKMVAEVEPELYAAYQALTKTR